jgi:cytosine/adenosine deaminase-related metal-dependent hydrolase
MTTNPARLLQLPHKGSIAIGADADLLVLRHDNLKLQYVYARGVCKRTPQWVQGGFFERGSRIRPFAPLVEEGAGGSSGGGGSGAGKSCCG